MTRFPPQSGALATRSPALQLRPSSPSRCSWASPSPPPPPRTSRPSTPRASLRPSTTMPSSPVSLSPAPSARPTSRSMSTRPATPSVATCSTTGGPKAPPASTATPSRTVRRHQRLLQPGLRGRCLQFIPDLVWTDKPSVSLMPVGEETLSSRVANVRRDGRRAGGGGDARGGWLAVVRTRQRRRRARRGEDGIYDAATGHTIVGAFADWYTSHEGPYYLGSPISQAVRRARHGSSSTSQGALLMTDRDGRIIVGAVVSRAGRSRSGRHRAGRTATVSPSFSEPALSGEPANPNPPW